MSGIIADMTIINILLRNYFPKLIPFLEEKNDNYGDFIGNNFINTNLINLFTNGYFDKETSLLIWDLLFIDGNMVLIKAFLNPFMILSPKEFMKFTSLKFPFNWFIFDSFYTSTTLSLNNLTNA